MKPATHTASIALNIRGTTNGAKTAVRGYYTQKNLEMLYASSCILRNIRKLGYVCDNWSAKWASYMRKVSLYYY